MTHPSRPNQTSRVCDAAYRRLRVVLLLLVTPVAAGAEPASPASDGWLNIRNWRPSLSVSLEAQQQRAEAEIESTLGTDVVSPNNPTPIALSADDHNDYFVPIVPIELSLESPPIDLPRIDLRPHLFFSAGYEFVPITERDFLVAGKFVPLPPNPTAASEGLGGEVRIDLQHQWSLSAGVVIPIEIEGIPIEIRPGVVYRGQWLRADATAIGVQVGTDALFTLASEDSKAVHYLGPQLSIETEAGRSGPWLYTVFARGSILFSRIGGSQSLRGNDIDAGETMRFNYEPDSALFRVGAGLRVTWDPDR